MGLGDWLNENVYGSHATAGPGGQYGGQKGGAADQAAYYNNRGINDEMRGGPQIDSSQWGMQNAQQNAARGSQSDALSMMQQAAQGGAPSQAQIQMSQGIDQSIAAQNAMAHSASGNGSAIAAAQRQAAMGAAGMQQAGVNQSAQLRAQEMAQARQQYGNAANAQRGQDISTMGMGMQNAQAQAGLNMQQNQLNDQTALGWGQLGQNAQLGQLQADTAAGNNATNASIAQANNNAAAGGAIVGGVAGLASAAGGAMMMSDERVKARVEPVASKTTLGPKGRYGADYITSPAELKSNIVPIDTSLDPSLDRVRGEGPHHAEADYYDNQLFGDRSAARPPAVPTAPSLGGIIARDDKPEDWDAADRLLAGKDPYPASAWQVRAQKPFDPVAAAHADGVLRTETPSIFEAAGGRGGWEQEPKPGQPGPSEREKYGRSLLIGGLGSFANAFHTTSDERAKAAKKSIASAGGGVLVQHVPPADGAMLPAGWDEDARRWAMTPPVGESKAGPNGEAPVRGEMLFVKPGEGFNEAVLRNHAEREDAQEAQRQADRLATQRTGWDDATGVPAAQPQMPMRAEKPPLAPAGAPSLLARMTSDERSKSNVGEGGMRGALGALQPYTFDYKQPDVDGYGRRAGIMAQDAIRHPVSRMMVEQMPDGHLALDRQKVEGFNLAAVADLDKRMRELETGARGRKGGQ